MAGSYQPPEGKDNSNKSALIGIGITTLLFLAIPLTQLFIRYEKSTEMIDALDMAPPPPPPPLEDEPPPPPPEEEPPPELDTPSPPITLEQINMSLEPGIGSSLSGDFALPTFDVDAKSLGGLDIFDISELDQPPVPRRQISPVFPPEAKRMSLSGRVVVEFIVTTEGRVIDAKVVSSSDSIFNNYALDAVRKWVFTPGEKGGKKVNTRVQIPIPFR